MTSRCAELSTLRQPCLGYLESHDVPSRAAGANWRRCREVGAFQKVYQIHARKDLLLLQPCAGILGRPLKILHSISTDHID